MNSISKKHTPSDHRSPSGPGDALDRPIPYRLASPRVGPGIAKAGLDRDYPIFAFKWVMLGKLSERQDRHGRGSWRHVPAREHLTRLHGEVAELDEALDRLESSTNVPDDEKRVLRQQVAREAADVANYCMFLSYVVGAL